jgi:MFS family permease
MSQKKDIKMFDLLSYKDFTFALLCMVVWTASFMYQSTLINPMLTSIYDIKVELSSMFFTISGIAFILATPIAFILRTKRLMRRRVIMYCALTLMGIACVVRTGNITGNKNLYWCWVGQILNGMALSLLSTTSFPEIVDAIERTAEYPYYNKDEVQLYVSMVFVMFAAVAQGIGTFFGSFIAELTGYTGAFVVGGGVTWLFTLVYALVCGGGQEDPEPKEGEEEEKPFI